MIHLPPLLTALAIEGTCLRTFNLAFNSAPSLSVKRNCGGQSSGKQSTRLFWYGSKIFKSEHDRRRPQGIVVTSRPWDRSKE